MVVMSVLLTYDRNADELLAINDMAIVRWTHEAVVNQFLCLGVGDVSLVREFFSI